MKPDSVPRLGALATLLLLVLTATLAGQSQSPVGALDRLMSRIASTAGASVRYREEKTLSFLEHPLVSYGTLRFEEPDLLIREVDGSTKTRYIVSSSTIRIEEAGKDTREMQLDDYPALRKLMETMRAVFAGDLARLKSMYRVQLKTDTSGWTLILDPREDDISRFVSRVEVSGQGAHIKSIETLETGGDRVVTTLLGNG